MNRDLIEQLSKESGLEPDGTGYSSGGWIELERFAELVAKECAQVCTSQLGGTDVIAVSKGCAAAILARFGIKP